MGRIELLLVKLKITKPLTRDEAVIIRSALILRTLAAQLRVLPPFLAEYDKVLQSTFDQHPHAALRSVPVAGEGIVPRLLTAFGSDRSRFANADAMSTLHRTSYPVQRQKLHPSFALRLCEVPAPKLSRVRRRFHISLCLGQSVLREPACSQQGPSHRHSCSGLQMDPHPSCLLEITNPYNGAHYLQSLRNRLAPIANCL